ncbi:MAG: hypothetical protein ACRDL7_08800, partial [Gaiellaceae bacterium]
GRSVQKSIEALDTRATSLRAWRARVSTLSDQLTDSRAAVDATIDRLRAAYVDQRTNIFVPRRAPLWQGGFGAELRAELPRVPEELGAYARGTYAYVESNPRPLVVQVLLAALLMVGLRRLSARARQRLGGGEESARMVRLLERPYAVGLLLALMATAALHPLAPRRFVQLAAILALLPVARIVMHATGRSNVTAFAGLLVLFLLDRFTLALAALPALTSVSFLVLLAAAFGLSFSFKRRIDRSGDAPKLQRVANCVLIGLALAFVAEIGGWGNLATLIGRAIMSGAISALYVYAAVVTLNPLLVYVLASPTIRRSRLLDRRAAALQSQAERGLRWVGVILWLYSTLRAVGLFNPAKDGLRALLEAGVSVGALSLSIGGVLAFILTLLAARLLARIISGVLEEDVYPRAHLSRG